MTPKNHRSSQPKKLSVACPSVKDAQIEAAKPLGSPQQRVAGRLAGAFPIEMRVAPVDEDNLAGRVARTRRGEEDDHVG